MIRKSCLN